MTAKVCKYGHARESNETYCKVCSHLRSAARRARGDADWKPPVYLELAVKPWRVES